MDWLMKYSECDITGLRVCELYEHLLVRTDGMVRNVNPSPKARRVIKGWHGGSKTGRGSDNYRACTIPGTNKRITIHRAVALAFIDNPLDYAQVNHINHDTSCNDISNLEWCNNRQNSSMRKVHNEGKLVGCYYSKRNGKWISEITINGKKQWIGQYDTAQCAHDAYIAYKALHNII